MKDLTTDQTWQQIQYSVLLTIITPLFILASIVVVVWTLIENIFKVLIYHINQFIKKA